MGQIVREGSENLVGGEITSRAPHQIGLNEAILAENIDPRDQRGVTTRNGRELVSGINVGSFIAGGGVGTTTINGIKRWTANAGTTYLLVGCKHGLTTLPMNFFEAGGIWASISWASYSTSLHSELGFKAEPLNNVVVLCNRTSIPQKYVAGASALVNLGGLSGSAIHNSKYCAVYISKMFMAGNPVTPQTLTWSASNNPEDWTTVDNAGNTIIRSGGGDTIQGLAANKKVLLIFFKASTYMLYGSSTPELKVEKVLDRGLVSETGYVSIDEVTFFASTDAIYMVAGTRISDLTTLKFKETYKAITDKAKITLAVSGKLLLVVDYGAGKAYACDYTRNVWAEWTSQNWHVIDTDVDGTLYAGTGDFDSGTAASGLAYIYKLDTGTLDGSTASIQAQWRTPNLTFGWPDCPKNLNTLRVHAKPGIATMTVTYYKNGVSTGSTNALTFAGSGDHAWDGVSGQSQVRGTHLGMKFTWNGVGTVYGWCAYAEITTDKGQIPTEV